MKKLIQTTLLLLSVHIIFGQTFETGKLLVKFKEGSCPSINTSNMPSFQKNGIQNAFSNIGLINMEKAYPAAEELTSSFAKEKSLKFVAANVPRRYANLVARKGLEELNNLNEEQKSYITPLPIKVDLELPAYKMFLDMGMGHGSEMTPEKWLNRKP